MVFKTLSGEAAFMASYDASLARWPISYNTLLIPTRFGNTHVIVSGPEDGSPLVLLHAAGTSSTVWSQNVAALSRSYRTYLVDTVDEPGKSEWSSPFRSRSDCADWLMDVLDGLKIDRAHLGGMSRGGWLSLNFALAALNRVESLMLLAPMALVRPRLAFFAHFLVPMLFPSRARMHRTLRWLSATGQVSDERLVDQMYLAVKHFRFPKGGVFPTVLPDEELMGLSIPALLLIGERETLYEPNAALQRAVRLMPHVQAELIPEAGHLLIMEQAATVNDRMVRFLASTKSLGAQGALASTI